MRLSPSMRLYNELFTISVRTQTAFGENGNCIICSVISMGFFAPSVCHITSAFSIEIDISHLVASNAINQSLRHWISVPWTQLVIKCWAHLRKLRNPDIYARGSVVGGDFHVARCFIRFKDLMLSTRIRRSFWIKRYFRIKSICLQSREKSQKIEGSWFFPSNFWLFEQIRREKKNSKK